MQAVCEFLGKKEEKEEYAALSAAVNCAVNARFYEEEKGLYKTFETGEHYSETANAFAVLCGAPQAGVPRRYAAL